MQTFLPVFVVAPVLLAGVVAVSLLARPRVRAERRRVRAQLGGVFDHRSASERDIERRLRLLERFEQLDAEVGAKPDPLLFGYKHVLEHELDARRLPGAVEQWLAAHTS